MRTDPAGRAGLSQRGSNSEMRVGEGRRSLQMVKNGGFSKEEEGREALMRRMERLKR